MYRTKDLMIVEESEEGGGRGGPNFLRGDGERERNRIHERRRNMFSSLHGRGGGTNKTWIDGEIDY